MGLESFGRIAAWALLGALVGRGMSYFIPNLHARRAMIGGAIGGTLGAVGFLAAAAQLNDLFGRLLGAAVLGFCIGAVVAFVELAYRQFWLQVSYGGEDFVNVSLGAVPVTVGSNARDCTVYADGAAPVALRYEIQDGDIICHDVPSGASSSVQVGNERSAGNVTVEVRGK